MKKRIVVTKNDIDLGVAYDGSSCPVARAAQRAFPHKNIFVGYTFIEIDGAVIDVPSRVREFIRDFDGQHGVSPIQFTIEA